MKECKKGKKIYEGNGIKEGKRRMKKIRKAVIPAAGLGTRMLPISKSVPKEMLPIDAKPALQYLIEEAAAAGITDVLVITAAGKESIEKHFTIAHEYERKLLESGKTDMFELIRRPCDLANLYFLYQHEQKGLGHAVLRAKNFVGDEPFAVMYGDDVIISEKPAIGQLAAVYEKYGKPTAGVKHVPTELVSKYCSLKAESADGREDLFYVSDMIEKPNPYEIFSNLAILGRVVLDPDIFGILERTAPGAGGEIQLTDAMRAIARTRGMMALDFEGKRFDIGNKLSYLMANVEVALKNPDYGDKFRDYLKGLNL